MAVEGPVQRRQHPSPTELLSLTSQGLLHSLVPNQDHHTPLGSQVHGEYRSILLTQLGAGREKGVMLLPVWMSPSWPLSLDEPPTRNKPQVPRLPPQHSPVPILFPPADPELLTSGQPRVHPYPPSSDKHQQKWATTALVSLNPSTPSLPN